MKNTRCRKISCSCRSAALQVRFFTASCPKMPMFLNKTPPSRVASETAVEIELWEGYLARNNSGLRKTLCTYSLDNGPLPGIQPETLLFRFLAFDWINNIRQLLEKNNIHYAVLAERGVDTMQQLRKKIYVAEDDPDILFALSAMLENAGYHVRMSNCGKPIVEGSYGGVDLFILDRQMPDINGLDLCRYLRSQSSTQLTPIILISAVPNRGNEVVEAGANDYIEKPFQMPYLLNIVSKYTRQPP